jgi:hypothetical protein
MNSLLKVLAVFIAIFGLGSLAIGVAALFVVDMSVENMRLMREGGYPALPGVDLETFRWVMYANAVALIISGILSAVSGVGLFLKRNWGRLLWLGTLGLLMIGTVYSLVMNYINRADWERVLSNCLVLLVYMALFHFFSRGSTKELFVRNNYAT